MVQIKNLSLLKPFTYKSANSDLCFAAMTQRNLSTNTTRSVQRLDRWIHMKSSLLHHCLPQCLISTAAVVFNPCPPITKSNKNLLLWPQNGQRISFYFNLLLLICCWCNSSSFIKTNCDNLPLDQKLITPSWCDTVVGIIRKRRYILGEVGTLATVNIINLNLHYREAQCFDCNITDRFCTFLFFSAFECS